MFIETLLENFFGANILSSSFLHHDIDHPGGTFHYAVSGLHCRGISLAQDEMGVGAI
jgi:hypothetical protein